MKTIVYFEDGAIVQTSWADIDVAKGLARYATEQEIKDYEAFFEQCDQEIENLFNEQ